MAQRATVLIVSMVGQAIDFVETLRRDDAVALAVDRQVDLGEALALVRADPAIAVALLISQEKDIERTVRDLRAARPMLHIVAVSLENGTAAVSLRDPNFDEFHLVVRALLAPSEVAAAAVGAGKLYKIRMAEPPARTAPKFLPVPVAEAPTAEAVALIEEAMQWAETAMRRLMAIWRADEGTAVTGFVPAIEALDRWLIAWETIRAAPAFGARAGFQELLVLLETSPGAEQPLGRIAALLAPDRIALKLFLIVLAGDLDMRFARSFGTLHDDLGRRAASVGLACAIVAAATDDETPISIRSHFGALEQLRRLGLIDGAAPSLAALDEPLRVSPALLDWIVSNDVEALVRNRDAAILRPAPEQSAKLISPGRRRLLATAEARVTSRDADLSAIVLTGSAPGWFAADAAALSGPALWIAPPPSETSQPAVEAAMRMIMVASRLTGRPVVIDLREENPAFWASVRPLLSLAGQAPHVLSANAATLLAASPGERLAVVTLPPPSPQSRREALALALGGGSAGDLVDRIAGLIPAEPDMLPDAVALAGFAAAEAGRPGDPLSEDWMKGFRLAAGSRLPQFATAIEPRPAPAEGEPGWLDTVILPEAQRDQLRSVIRHVRFSRTVLDEWGFGRLLDARGVAALLAGESGTGKTMAAHCIASDLQADLYVIDLSQVVSKYIGETEKHLDIVFADAERAGAVLLFDEADALFGKRSAVSHAHDRYANMEVAYLLQRLQQFRGLVLLTSNHPESIDPAFTRRLRFRIDFPRPTASSRLAIWEQSIPIERRADDVDLKRIAYAVDVTGGTIRQMAVHAAMLAAEAGTVIGMGHILAGVRGELIRLGAYADLARLDGLDAGGAAAVVRAA